MTRGRGRVHIAADVAARAEAEMSAAVATGEKAFGVNCPDGPGLAGEADPEPGVLDDAASRLLAAGCADPFGTGPAVRVHTGIRQRPGIIGCLRTRCVLPARRS
jgi:hypothetical protein